MNSSVLHIVSLPADTGVQRGFSMILEVDDGTEVDERMVAGWRDFARDSGARGLMITTRDLVILHQPAEDVPPPGPCPSYTEGMGATHTCDLRARHDGLHEEVKPAQITTWGDRLQFISSTGFYSVATTDRPLDLKAASIAGGYVAPQMTREEIEEQFAGAENFNTGPYVAPSATENCGVRGCTRPPDEWSGCPTRGCNANARAMALHDPSTPTSVVDDSTS